MTTTSLLTAAGALAAVLLLVVLAGRLARLTRFARPRGAPGQLRVEEQITLDPRRRLLLIHCDGRRVLLLTGPQDCVVGWLPEPSA